MRHAGPARFRLSSPAARRYEGAGRKLLGELIDRARMDGVTTLALQRTLPDGSLIVARLINGQPIIEITEPKVAGGDVRVSARLSTTQGFVVTPSSPDDATYPQVLLVPEWSALDHAKYRYAPPRNELFIDGLKLAGAVDWRGHDEATVISWDGPSDRYGMTTGVARTRSLKVFINGDEIANLSGITGLTTDDAVIGACLQDKTLVVAVARERQNSSTPARLRLYTATLVRKSAGLQWALGFPFKHHPRYEAIADGDFSLAYEETFDGDDWVGFSLADSGIDTFTGPPLAFNQSATEGRCILYYRVDRSSTYPDESIRELIVDISDLEDIVVDLQVRDESPYVDFFHNDTDKSFRFAAMSIKSGFIPALPAPPVREEVERWEGRNNASLSYAYFKDWTREEGYVPHDAEWVPIAVDYKNDVPVYAYSRQREHTWSGSYTSSPEHTSTAYYLGGYSEATNIASHDGAWTETWAGLQLPWDVIPEDEEDPPEPFELLCEGSGSSSGSSNCLASVEGGEEPAGTPISSAFVLDSTGEYEETSTRQQLILYYLDLRTDFVVYAIKQTETTIDEDYTWTSSGSFGSPSRTIVTDRNNTVVTKLRSVVHVAGVDVADSGFVTVDTQTTTGSSSSSAGLGGAGPISLAMLEAWGWHIPSAWSSQISGTLISITPYTTPANTDDAMVQDWIDAMPTDPDENYSVGTYDFSGVDAVTVVDDVSDQSPANAFGGAAASYPPLEGQLNSLFGSGNPMTWCSSTAIGGWCADRNAHYVVSSPWPGDDGDEGWLNQVSGGDPETTIEDVTANDSPKNFPVWLTGEFAYEFKTQLQL